eukprot:31516-Pelagococcus_subviridis.AAC.2
MRLRFASRRQFVYTRTSTQTHPLSRFHAADYLIFNLRTPDRDRDRRTDAPWLRVCRSPLASFAPIQLNSKSRDNTRARDRVYASTSVTSMDPASPRRVVRSLSLRLAARPRRRAGRRLAGGRLFPIPLASSREHVLEPTTPKERGRGERVQHRQRHLPHRIVRPPCSRVLQIREVKHGQAARVASNYFQSKRGAPRRRREDEEDPRVEEVRGAEDTGQVHRGEVLLGDRRRGHLRDDADGIEDVLSIQ